MTSFCYLRLVRADTLKTRQLPKMRRPFSPRRKAGIDTSREGCRCGGHGESSQGLPVLHVHTGLWLALSPSRGEELIDLGLLPTCSGVGLEGSGAGYLGGLCLLSLGCPSH